MSRDVKAIHCWREGPSVFLIRASTRPACWRHTIVRVDVKVESEWATAMWLVASLHTPPAQALQHSEKAQLDNNKGRLWTTHAGEPAASSYPGNTGTQALVSIVRSFTLILEPWALSANHLIDRCTQAHARNEAVQKDIRFRFVLEGAAS